MSESRLKRLFLTTLLTITVGTGTGTWVARALKQDVSDHLKDLRDQQFLAVLPDRQNQIAGEINEGEIQKDDCDAYEDALGITCGSAGGLWILSKLFSRNRFVPDRNYDQGDALGDSPPVDSQKKRFGSFAHENRMRRMFGNNDDRGL